jgi:hypothetical protein
VKREGLLTSLFRLYAATIMLMPPDQNQDSPPTTLGTDKNLDPNYKFIFNGDQQPKQRFRLPGGGSLTKLTILIVAAAAIVGVLIIILSSFFGSKGVNTKEVVDLIARAQEITRVSNLVAKQSKDSSVINLATTSTTTLNSDQAQLVNYIHKKTHKKINTKDINAYKDSKIDNELQIANQTNSLSSYYYSYLKKHLTEYRGAIQLTGNDNPASIRPILQQALASSSNLLSDPQLSTATAR